MVRSEDASSCLICGEEAAEGLIVREQLICPRCEQEITEASADEPGYDRMVSRCRLLWRGVAL